MPALDDAELARIEEQAGLGRLRGALAAALATVSQREALRLRVVEELPYDEVARRLGPRFMADDIPRR